MTELQIYLLPPGYYLHPHTAPRAAHYTAERRASEVCISRRHHTTIVAGDKGACNLCNDTTAAGERSSSEMTREQNVPLIKHDCNKTVNIPPEALSVSAAEPYRGAPPPAAGLTHFLLFFRI